MLFTAVGHVDLDVADRLAHALDPVEILDERDLDEYHRVKGRAALVLGVLLPHKVINKRPVYGTVDQAQEMVFRDELVHGEELYLLAILVFINCHHKARYLR